MTARYVGARGCRVFIVFSVIQFLAKALLFCRQRHAGKARTELAGRTLKLAPAYRPARAGRLVCLALHTKEKEARYNGENGRSLPVLPLGAACVPEFARGVVNENLF